MKHYIFRVPIKSGKILSLEIKNYQVSAADEKDIDILKKAGYEIIDIRESKEKDGKENNKNK